MVVTLYKTVASPPVRAVLMTIEALDLSDVEYVDVNLLQGDNYKQEFVAMNPQHTVPTLVDDDFVIWDSHAIATYLISMYSYGSDDSLYPREPKQRAVVDQRLHFDSGIIFPPLREAAKHVIFEGQKVVNPKTLERLSNVYELTEKFLTTPWMAGDEITVADICCVASISSINEILTIDELMYPQLTGWLKRCSEQEFYRKGNEPGLLEFRALLKIA